MGGFENTPNRILLNDGFGTFTYAPLDALPASHFPVAINATAEIKCRDFDLDGWPDAIVSSTSNQWEGAHILERGAGSFRAAAAHVHQLPYGRTSKPEVYLQVLREARGTCSSKHALLAALAQEQGLDGQLMLGLFEMIEANTPGVGAALHRYGLAAIPEAHCFLLAAGERLDLTHPGSSGTCTLHFLREMQITPVEAGAYKQAWHREQMAHWAAERGFDVALLWRAREQCIADLSSHVPA